MLRRVTTTALRSSALSILAPALCRPASSSTMSLTHVVARNAEEFNAALTGTHGSAPVVFALFTGAKDATTGVSWCPDCVSSAGATWDALRTRAASAPTVVIEVPLPREEYRGNAAHWARVHPSVRLQRIPTLFKYGESKRLPEDALIEGECGDVAALEKLME